VEGEGTDDLVRKARKAMVSTYGQTPKKLFAFPHPRPQIQPNEACEQEAVDTVWGIRWGQYLGSPASPDLDVFNTREYREPVSLFETSSRIVFWPKNTLILGDAVVGSWDATGIRIKSNVVHLCIGDEVRKQLYFVVHIALAIHFHILINRIFIIADHSLHRHRQHAMGRISIRSNFRSQTGRNPGQGGGNN